jgi:hypothetical protein
MTAEVAILNTAGVALAADSAVTVGGQGATKVYSNVNKLFGLSRQQPVGIMIHNSAVLAGLPWEPIIKCFRTEVGDRRQPTLAAYAEEFRRFLNARTERFYPGQVQKQSLHLKLRQTFEALQKRCQRASLRRIGANPQLLGDTTALGNDIAKVVAAAHRSMEAAPFVDGLTEDDAVRLRTEHSDPIEKMLKATFPWDHLSADVRGQLTQLAGWYITKSYPSSHHTGVVIAGYGEDEMFPSLVAIEVTGVLEDRALTFKEGECSIGHFMPANVVPFAQDDMVVSFMEGIEERVRAEVDRRVHDLAATVYPNLVRELAQQLGIGQADVLAQNVRQAGQGVVDQFGVQLTSFVRQKVARPVVEAVAHLPKEELGAMAESLVNLTSLRLHVSFAADTVGGPVDVAVISKGDGFVWLRRKHYFRAELNPHFLAGYYRSEGREGGGRHVPTEQADS